MVNCSSANNHACFQADIKFDNGSQKFQSFEKGCLQIKDCEAYSKGEIGECTFRKGQGYDVDCKAMCCHEDECNKGNIIAEREGSVFVLCCCYHQ